MRTRDFINVLFEKNFNDYEQALIKIPFAEIDQHAVDTMKDLTTSYEEHLRELTEMRPESRFSGLGEAIANIGSYITVKGVCITLGVVVVAGLVYFGITKLIGASDSFDIMKQGVDTVAELTKVSLNRTNAQEYQRRNK